MKSTVENLEDTRAKLTVEVDYDELTPQMEQAYAELGKQVNVPGFRPGHVPARVIDQRLGRGYVIEQVINQVLPGYYSQAIVENKLRPMDQPEVEVVEVPAAEGEPGGVLKFTAEVDVVPPFDIPSLDDREVVVDAAVIDDDAVQAELDELRGRFATLKNLDRAAADGDFLTLDLSAAIDGEEIDSLSEVSYELGSGNMLEGQDEALRGAEPGNEVTFVSKIRGGEHAGSDADITIKVTAVKERELPEADDDFAQMVSEFDTAEELLEDLGKQVQRAGLGAQAMAARDSLLKQLVAETEILLPAAVIDKEVARRVEEDADEETVAQVREAIENDLRQQVFLEQLATEIEVQVGQEELLQFIFQTAQNFGMDVNQVIQDQNQISNMAAELARIKALVSVLAKTTVKDSDGNIVDVSEFTADTSAKKEEEEVEVRGTDGVPFETIELATDEDEEDN